MEIIKFKEIIIETQTFSVTFDNKNLEIFNFSLMK